MAITKVTRTLLSTGIVDNSNATAITIDSSENVGIGTSSISGRLEIKKATASNETMFAIEASGVTTTTVGSITYDQSDDSMRLLNNSDFGGTSLRLGTRGNDNVIIDYSGNVGIGATSANSSRLRLDNGGTSGAPQLMLTATGASTQTEIRHDTSNNLIFENWNSGRTERMRIDSSGNVGIGTSSPSAPLTVSGADGTLAVFTNASDADFQFKTASGVALITPSTGTLAFGTSSTERMRIDSSGNLLVGTTSATAGISASSGGGFVYRAGNELTVHREGINSESPCAIFNQTGLDGQIVRFRKDGTTVGSISSVAGLYTAYGTQGNTGYLASAGNNEYAWDPDRIYPTTDNAQNLGLSSLRFKDLYLSGGAYLGGTGSANHLDDYEEGTWTGTLTGSTSAPSTAITATGTYTKIGRSVTVVILFSNRNSTGVSGNIVVTGLPFTATAGGLGVGWHSRSNTGTGTNNGVMSYLASNNDLLIINGLGQTVTWASSGTGTYAQYTMTYKV